MAIRKRTTATTASELQFGGEGGHAYYCGTRNQLIAAQIVRDGDFPGDPQSGRRSDHTFRRDGRRISIRFSSRLEPPTFWVHVNDEQDKRPLERGPEQANPKARGADRKRQAPDNDDDDDWPPAVRHNPAIEIGDGSRWHYLAAPDVLLCEGILDADEIPGNPACKFRWRTSGWHEGVAFQATRLGNRVAVTLLTDEASIISCSVLLFKVR